MVRKCRLLQISPISTLSNLHETMVGKTGFAESNFQMDSLNTSKGFATTTELTKISQNDIFPFGSQKFK